MNKVTLKNIISSSIKQKSLEEENLFDKDIFLKIHRLPLPYNGQEIHSESWSYYEAYRYVIGSCSYTAHPFVLLRQVYHVLKSLKIGQILVENSVENVDNVDNYCG